ncbi:MAG TPA: IPTL-CTERM sorting domain-containing protein, partial [Casimicrobiaceae bacterium]|nr:IPTL-CTERM sorting domain-containing protein [Casimicrobiaceae bacterium]
TGPTQAACDTAYGGAITVTVSGGIQSWTVPATGTYHVVATGAQGASGSEPSFVGGRGAQVSGDFALTAGQVLKLVVGQVGTNGGNQNGGGGGGSFVVNSSNAPMLVAGGGGGTRAEASQNGCDASVTQFAVTGSGGSPTSTCALETSDLGLGGIVSSNSWGSAGAGFNGDGATDPNGGGTHSGGYSWANGMLGGTTDTPCSTSAPGGFGGGGAGNGCWGGGGGGGYSGGDGGWIAGGGGSFNSGTAPAAAVAATTGDGQIVISNSATVATAVPTLSQWGLIVLGGLLAFAALITLRRRAG